MSPWCLVLRDIAVKLRFVGILALCCVGLSGNVEAIVIRHDKKDAEYQEYAKSKNEFKAVGIVECGAKYFWTGTLIHPKFILTAAHAVDGDPEAKNSSIRFSPEGKEYKITKWVTHPYWVPGTSENKDIHLFGLGFDFAIGMLEQEVQEVQPVARFDRKQHGLEEGKRISIVGYGVTGDGKSGCKGCDCLKRAGTNTVEFLDHLALMGVKDPHPGISNRLYFTEFKNPENEARILSLTRLLTGAELRKPTEITELECSFNYGDSGGASFVNIEGRELLAGVCSFTVTLKPGGAFTLGKSHYGDVSGYGAVGAVNDWIDEVLRSYSKDNNPHLTSAR